MSTYFNKQGLPVEDGDDALASDLNNLIDETDQAFEQVEQDISSISTKAYEYAETEPFINVDVGTYSAKHYSYLAEQWAAGTPVDNSGNPTGDESAMVHALNAANSASSASASELNAANSASSADSSAVAASGSASDAALSATASATSASESLAAKDKAEDWASEAEDVVVESGKYSAYHWAKKAEEYILSWGESVKTTHFTAEVGFGYQVDTLAGLQDLTLTLPLSPGVGDILALNDYSDSFFPYNCILDGNGENIEGSASDHVLSLNGFSTYLVYADSTKGWIFVNSSPHLGDPTVIPGKNLLINGAMDVWQRGTSFTGIDEVGEFTADRWYVASSNEFNSVNVSRSSNGPGDRGWSDFLLDPTYNMYVTLDVNGPLAGWIISQPIEGGLKRTGGRTLTISFTTNESADISEKINCKLYQDFGTGGSATVTVERNSPGFLFLEQGRIHHTVSFDVPSIAGKTLGTDHHLRFEVSSDLASPPFANYSFHIGGLQLEIGDEATAFDRKTYEEELSACQRYYWRVDSSVAGLGYKNNSAGVNKDSAYVSFPTTMRISPSIALEKNPIYDNCSAMTFVANQDGVISRVTVSATGTHRAYYESISADAEIEI